MVSILKTKCNSVPLLSSLFDLFSLFLFHLNILSFLVYGPNLLSCIFASTHYMLIP